MSDPMDLDGYFNGLKKGVLCFQRCESCSRAQFPPRAVCAQCRSSALGWETFPPTASVFTWTVVGHTALAGFGERTPYAVAVLEVANLGIRVVGRVDNLPESITFGARCRWTIVAGPDGSPVPLWTLDQEEEVP